MDDYGIYIWPAYAITIFVLCLNIFFALREKHKTYSLLKNNHEPKTKK